MTPMMPAGYPMMTLNDGWRVGAGTSTGGSWCEMPRALVAARTRAPTHSLVRSLVPRSAWNALPGALRPSRAVKTTTSSK